MYLPRLSNPQTYAGHYVIDFGAHASVGYTAEEVAWVLADPRYGSAKAYHIYRVQPDGRMELRGVAADAMTRRETTVFMFADPAEARKCFHAAREAAANQPPDFPLELELLDTRAAPAHHLLIVYPAASSPAAAAWMQALSLEHAQQITAGAHPLDRHRGASATVVQRWISPVSAKWKSRPREEVLAAVHLEVQR